MIGAWMVDVRDTVIFVAGAVTFFVAQEIYVRWSAWRVCRRVQAERKNRSR